MSEPTTIQGARGALPNPKGFGLNWKPLQKLLGEQQRLWGALRDTDFRYKELEGQISVMERAEFEALADSYRDGGSEPDDANIVEARAELEKVKKRAAAQSRALEKVDAEIMAVVRRHAPQWRREVNAKAKERAEAVEDAVHRLQAAQGELYAMSALGEWLDRPRGNFGFRPGPKSIDTFEHKGMRLGEIFDAIVSDAREKAATPDEQVRQMWASMGAVDSPGVGWTA